jgi:guanylate kinase
MDYILQGDRPVSYFHLNQAEFDQFIESGDYVEIVDRVNMKTYYEYKGVRIVVD